MHLDDTIVAIATPPGRGGIGVVRLSGSEARNIARPMLRLAHGHDFEAGRAHFGELIDPATGERIDEVVATFFAKPHSYTTDDVVEISCHGSPVVLRHVVEMAINAGARLAEPGEFTMRAFLNGRIDLTQAEAVRDLIDSQTLYQAQVAARQLEGALSKRLQPTKQKLVELIATMEAGVDFAEDDVSVIPDEQILARIAGVREPLAELLASFAFGKVVHEGLTLAIVGASQRRQVEPVQPAGGARTRHRHRYARHHARPGQRNRVHRRHSGAAGRHRRHSRRDRRSRKHRRAQIHGSAGRGRPGADCAGLHRRAIPPSSDFD